MGIGPLLLRVIWSFRDNMSPQSFAVHRVSGSWLSVDDLWVEARATLRLQSGSFLGIIFRIL